MRHLLYDEQLSDDRRDEHAFQNDEYGDCAPAAVGILLEDSDIHERGRHVSRSYRSPLCHDPDVVENLKRAQSRQYDRHLDDGHDERDGNSEGDLEKIRSINLCGIVELLFIDFTPV